MREFHELASSLSAGTQSSPVYLLEVGCGVGNFLLPFLQANPTLHGIGCDISPRAVAFLQQSEQFDPSRCHAFTADATRDDLLSAIPSGPVDYATLVFVLSAIPPSKMSDAVRNVARAMKPGGLLFMRDYGLYDHAQMRFGKGRKLEDNFYVRQDGTMAYFFDLERVEELARDAGLEVVENQYVKRETVNVKEGVRVPRIFVQSKLRKPVSQE